MLVYYLLFTFNIITIPINRYSQKTYWYLNAILIWIIMAFKSFTVGSDTPAYVSLYRNASTTIIPKNFVNWFFPANGARFENGYLVLNKFLASIDSNPQFLFVTVACIFILCLTFMVQNLHLNPIMGILTFECLGFLAFFMSGLRQALACSFCMVAFVFAIKREPVKFILFYYLALSMHVSAIVFVVVYLINFLGTNLKSKISVMFILLIFFFSFDGLFASVATNSNSEEMSSFATSTENSGGILNVTLSILIIITILIAVRYIDLPKNDHKPYTFSKYMLYGAIIYYLLSLRSTQLARIAIYFEIGYFPLLSYLFDFTKQKFRFVYQSIIITILIVYIFVILIFRPEWTHIVPYSFCF